ncbi:23S rRNA (pseudouridine1915-N3)-methyltransferase [Salsuginibacillus halophilus]|uniref:Ribosomal RNA large subunit methyltransferase H n=1 Tax=Salsuginibacillus halophilus TaxID=517424 RepID=A0A2P8HI64_9BACI|nr:23S rRNA (pseudouridine(1915)-N(3))-methyltransferase RlmH [Salsuginibacillus halophilus]PSL45909.1 23S rRNA (pseudouridine1915-N3)-methyltransferase [Salsuginibacillus halophilus]
MQITIIAVGKLKEKYLKTGIEEYEKRLSNQVKVNIVEVPDAPAPDKFSEKEEAKVKETEGEKILQKVPKDTYVIALDPEGKMISSETLASKLDDLAVYGQSKVTFVIGGSLGLSRQVLKRADFSWSFSKLTFPHQLMRLMLLEQVYRAFQIQKGTPYHK